MKPTFALIHAENVNKDQDSICHLIIVPVVEGIRQPAKEFFFNPEAPFYLVMSGIGESDVMNFPTYQDQWPEVQSILDGFDICLSSADGYAARSLFGTLTRLRIDFKPIKYCTAKAICRRTLDEVSYSLDYLSYVLYNDCITTDEPVAIAERWTDLALKGLEKMESESIDDFCSKSKIKMGRFSPDSFDPSLCLRDYSKRNKHQFDPTSISVDAQPNNDLYGMSVVFTGKMEAMKRDDARAAVIRIGGFAPDRLTMETDYLVVGVQDLRVVGEKGLSGKMKTAAKYKEKGCNIEIIDEQDFLEMLNAGK
ncbi:MAG: hypothetical protein K2M56_00875 [Muribaculaceae bacterium]|nr:hypothetical protein [Muribaculaceae bacterium]